VRPLQTEKIHAVRHHSVVILATVCAPWPSGCLLTDSNWMLQKLSSCGVYRLDGDTSFFQPTSWQSAPSQSHQSTVSATLASFSTVTCQWTLTSLGSSARVSEFWDKYAASAPLASTRRSTIDVSYVVHHVQDRNCNVALALAGLPQRELDRIQSMLNAAARLTADARKFDHVTPLLVNLHWLGVPERIQYKLCILVHRCINRAARWHHSICRS